MRKTLTDKGVAALKPRKARYAYPDPELRGHWVRVQPSGGKAYYAVALGANGRQVWTRLGAADGMLIADARIQARSVLQRVRAGLTAFEPKAETFGVVADNWLTRHVDASGLIWAKELRRLLKVHVLPEWAEREFVAIRRSDVVALLDRVEDRHGARQADHVLNLVRAVMNWVATRHDDYSPPIVRGMARRKTASRARFSMTLN
jgi:hypothetical protein